MFKKLSDFWARFGFYISLVGALALIAGAAIGYRMHLPVVSVQQRSSPTPLTAAAINIVTPAPAEPLNLTMPLTGEWIMPYSPDQVIYDSVLDAYTAHCGIDIAGNPGDPVSAAADGKITALYKSGEYGYTLEIEHADGFIARYGGIAPNPALSIGQRVYQGTVIAEIGNYPSSESYLGSHLHFEILLEGLCADPEDFTRRETISAGY